MTARSTQPPASVGTLCWHVHHEKLVEVLTEPLENRIAYIKRGKPKYEQALRLRLIKPVRGKLPGAVVKARAASGKTWAAYVKTWDAYGKARDAYVKAIQDNMPAIRALHAKECPDCPWDGKTIFSKKSEGRS